MEQSPAEELALALRTIYRRLELFRDAQLQVTPKELGLLLIVEENGSIRVKDLARQVQLPLSTVSWTADQMVRHRLLARKADPTDRRAIRLTLDRAGRAALRSHYRIFDLLVASALEMLTATEIQTLLRALRKIAGPLK